MLPYSEKVDEPNGQPWSQAGMVSAHAAFARSEEGERAYEDFVRAAQSLVRRLRHREQQLAKLGKISQQINLGLTLDEVLTFLYEELAEVIPYNRIGVAFIEDESGLVVVDWTKSDRGVLLNVTRERVVRLLPPLIIDHEQAEQIVEVVCDLIDQMAD